MKSKVVKTILAVSILSVAAYWYWSPFLTAYQMKTAIAQKDADRFNETVDYPKLRENLRSQFAAVMTDQMTKSPGNAGAFQALGTMLGLAMVNQFVDVMVRPEFIMRAMEEGRVNTPDAMRGRTQPVDQGAEKKEPEWSYDRRGINKLIIYVASKKELAPSPENRLGLVFERSGFADWKLTEMRLPNTTR